MDINQTVLVGNLTRDPELKTTATGKQMTRFSIASNRTFKGSSGEKQKETLYMTIVTWAGQAETCARFLKKGSKVLVVGRLTSREYNTDDGQKRRVYEIVAQEVQFLSTRNNENGAGYNNDGQASGDSYGDASEASNDSW